MKERELALKEKSIHLTDTAEKKEQKNIQPPTTIPNHSDFKAFWADFKTAVLTNNKSEVFKMVKISFLDGYENDVYFKKVELHSLTCKSSSEFYKKYEMIFNTQVIKAIKEDKVQGQNSEYYIYRRSQ